jgi:hypothetical protein
MPETPRTIARMILNGDADEDLNLIYNAYRERSKIVSRVKAQTAAVEFAIGDKARMCATTKPAYLRGVEVIITGRTATKATVRPVEEHAGARFGGEFRCPWTLLEKIA